MTQANPPADRRADSADATDSICPLCGGYVTKVTVDGNPWPYRMCRNQDCDYEELGTAAEGAGAVCPCLTRESLCLRCNPPGNPAASMHGHWCLNCDGEGTPASQPDAAPHPFVRVSTGGVICQVCKSTESDERHAAVTLPPAARLSDEQIDQVAWYDETNWYQMLQAVARAAEDHAYHSRDAEVAEYARMYRREVKDLVRISREAEGLHAEVAALQEQLDAAKADANEGEKRVWELRAEYTHCIQAGDELERKYTAAQERERALVEAWETYAKAFSKGDGWAVQWEAMDAAISASKEASSG